MTIDEEDFILAQLGRCEAQVAVNDAVCITVPLDAEDTAAIVLWTNETNYRINGTILVENNGAEGGPVAALTITGGTTPALTVEPGTSETITVDDITGLSLAATGGTGTANVKVSFSLNYKY